MLNNEMLPHLDHPMPNLSMKRDGIRAPDSGNVLRAKILRDLNHIEFPTLSSTAVRAMTLANSPEVSIPDLAALINSDAMLATAIFRRANNWTIGGRTQVADIRSAIIRVGLVECSKLVFAFGFRRINEASLNGRQKKCEALLKHSLLVANISTMLGKEVGFEPLREVFAAGLLHDIGRMILGVMAPLEIDIADPMDFEDQGIQLEREREVVGIDHCAIGFQFAQVNNFPEGMLRAILNHHRPEKEQIHRELVAVVATADRMSNYVQRHRQILSYELDRCPFFEVLSEDWPTFQRQHFLESVPAIVVKAIRETRSMLKSIG